MSQYVNVRYVCYIMYVVGEFKASHFSRHAVIFWKFWIIFLIFNFKIRKSSFTAKGTGNS